MTIIYMIRHADSPFVLGQERTRPLSQEGELAASRVTEIMRDVPIDVIVSSPYKRAIQTIEGLAKDSNKDITIIEELREKDLKGDFLSTEEELRESIRQSFEDRDFCLPGGESMRAVQHRAIPVIQDLLCQYEGKSIAIGTHGNIMTMIMNDFNSKYGYEFWRSTSKPDLYQLTFSGHTLEEVQRLWVNHESPRMRREP